MIERSRVRLQAAALSGNDLGQVVHTNVPLFTKQYNLVPCEGFHVNAPSVAANGMGPMNKGSIVVAVLRRSDRLELRYKLSTLLFFTLGGIVWWQISCRSSAPEVRTHVVAGKEARRFGGE